MRILVTGARGKVGRATVENLLEAGHDVTASDLGPPVFERDEPGHAAYFQADFTDAGQAFAAVRGHDAVIHAAAIPAPGQHPPHVVFQNNLMGTFNAIEAAVRWGLPRFVHVSSETAPGWFFAERPFLPDYLPIDEQHPVRPQDSYATAKWFGELLMERAPERADIATISIRPCWVQDVGSYERNLGPIVRDPSVLIGNFCSYVDVYDLCQATVLAVESELPGHEVLYVASPDTIGGHPLEEIVRRYHGATKVELRPLDRPDASAIDCSKARRLLGWEPRRSWSDYLDAEGRLKDGVAAPW